MPGYTTSPCMLIVCSFIAVCLVGMKSTSFSFKGMSATRPSMIPCMSTGMTRRVRSAFIRCMTARAVKASSVSPSACCTSERTLLMPSPS